MRLPFLIAALLSLAATAVHGLAGHVETYLPFMEIVMAREVKIAVAADWHAMTAFMLVSAVAFLWAALTKGVGYRPIGFIFGFFYLAFAGIVAWHSYYWFADPLVLSQWLLFAPIGFLSFFAAL